MAQTSLPGQVVPLPTVKTGALTAGGAAFTFDPNDRNNQVLYGAFFGQGFEYVQIVSPVAAAPADLLIERAGITYPLAGGGNVINIPGPIGAVKISAKNFNVAGSGADDVFITPFARLKVNRY